MCTGAYVTRSAPAAKLPRVRTVSRLSIAPVKGMALLHPEEIALDCFGVADNRRFHVIDADGRRYGQIRNGTLVRIVPRYDAGADRLELRFPGGDVVAGDVPVGEAVVRLHEQVARCAITTQNPETGVPDFDTLREIKAYRGARERTQIDFGVYGEVAEPGRVRLGDPIEPLADL